MPESALLQLSYMAINWHVNDLKVSNSDRYIVDNCIQWTKETYEDITRLNPSRGKMHDYLGTNLDSKTSGEVKIYIKEYIY